MKQKFGLLAGALALTVALAACGGGDGNSSSGNSGSKVKPKATTTTGAPAATTTSVAPASATVKAATVSLGNIVVSSDGKTLYTFANDQGTTAGCTGGCAGTWPPLKASGEPVVGSGLDASKLSKAPSGQVMYGGHLLYNYSGDTAPGQTNGQGLANLWHVVAVSGDIVS